LKNKAIDSVNQGFTLYSLVEAGEKRRIQGTVIESSRSSGRLQSSSLALTLLCLRRIRAFSLHPEHELEGTQRKSPDAAAAPGLRFEPQPNYDMGSASSL
jgi:hypothetical protein